MHDGNLPFKVTFVTSLALIFGAAYLFLVNDYSDALWTTFIMLILLGYTLLAVSAYMKKASLLRAILAPLAIVFPVLLVTFILNSAYKFPL